MTVQATAFVPFGEDEGGDLDGSSQGADPDAATEQAQQFADDNSSGTQTSSLRITTFLWKPLSERNNNLVVLVNPRNVTCIVNGDISEQLQNTGASNGRGSTLRGSFTGCRYGNDISVEFYDSLGRRIPTADGRLSVTVPNGCDRREFTL